LDKKTIAYAAPHKTIHPCLDNIQLPNPFLAGEKHRVKKKKLFPAFTIRTVAELNEPFFNRHVK
jgi:hypothetical protein